jgi:hypothetical protein
MTQVSRSLLAFAAYQAATGMVLLLWPKLAYAVFRLPQVQLLWRALVGMLLLILAYLCMRAALSANLQFMRWTVETRTVMAITIAVMVAFGQAPWPLLVFALADACAVAWTIVALRREGATP